jgi:hypothetical protein
MLTMQIVSYTMAVSMFLGLFLVPTAVAADSPWTEDQLKIATTFELMKGHLTSARENAKQGKIPLAQAHAAHPLHEEYAELPSTFATDHPALDKTLREDLTRLQQSVDGKHDATALGTAVDGVFKHLDHSLRTVIPADIRESAQFRSAVVLHLLEAIEEEYDEAVDDGKVVNVAEYQDAFGFLQRVRALTNQLADGLQAGDRQQLTSRLKNMEDALPTIMPPASPVSPEVVAKQADALAALLKKNTAK